MYKVFDTKNNRNVVILHEDGDTYSYATKMEAKECRDDLNGGKPKDDRKPRYVVARGPNHPKGETFGS